MSNDDLIDEVLGRADLNAVDRELAERLMAAINELDRMSDDLRKAEAGMAAALQRERARGEHT